LKTFNTYVMNYVEYNPVNPSPYVNYVSQVETKWNNTLLIVAGIIIIGSLTYFLYHQLQTNKKDEEVLV
jgi:hypothetical protein